IQHLYADFNSEVKKGQVIAQIDPAIFNARLAEAEANVRSSEAARDKATVVVQESRNTLTRVSGLFKDKLASDSQLDEARFAHEAATVEYRVKEATVAQAKAARQREQVNLAYTSISAPIDGVVISRDVDVGQTVAASLQAPTLFTIAQNLARMQIETDVDEAFIGMIKEQQPVKFTVFAYQDRYFTGRVSQVRLQPKVEAGVVKYNCIIHVDNTDLALKPGMTATVAIEVARKDNVLKVPNAALRFVPDWPAERLRKVRTKLKSDEAILWFPKGDELTPLKIQTGIVGERETEISGEGLQEGMTIVLPPKRKEAERRRRFGLSLF
ncbi:MAG: efflux RND transporter periplasmic adaptor subunit, partial [Gammaproteobacteria bacterium]|nr:efflux RND transporter periplasmic adaptor subunit [Gammaproteobacteria bacterium]